MHVLSKRPFNDAKKHFPNQSDALDYVYKVLSSNDYANPDELKAAFPSLDNFKHREKWYVIDIGGNHLRLLAYIHFEHGKFFVKHIATHADYDKLCVKYQKKEYK